MVESCIATADDTDGIEILTHIDADDRAVDEYARLDLPCRMIFGKKVQVPWNANLASASLLPFAAGAIFMTAADDIIFETPGWDTIVRAEFAKYPDGILLAYTNNGQGRRKCEHFFVTRQWVAALGYMVHPGFLHFCSDQWASEIAQAVGREIYLPEVVTRHMHFKYGLSERDDTYARVRSGSAADGRTHSELDNDLYKHLWATRLSDAEKLRKAIHDYEHREGVALAGTRAAAA